MKILTLCFVLKESQILLGQKKRGFGVGMWNGFGGKLERGESIEEATEREVFEEAEIFVFDLEKVGVVQETSPAWDEPLEIHIFTSKEILGSPQETEEMKPKWFSLQNLPYKEMWDGDKLWIPRILLGQRFQLSIVLDLNNKVVSSYETSF